MGTTDRNSERERKAMENGWWSQWLRSFPLNEERTMFGIELKKAKAVRVGMTRLRAEQIYFRSKSDPLMGDFTVQRLDEETWLAERRKKSW